MPHPSGKCQRTAPEVRRARFGAWPLAGQTRAEYDIGNKFLDPAMLAEAILCDEVEELLP